MKVGSKLSYAVNADFKGFNLLTRKFGRLFRVIPIRAIKGASPLSRYARFTPGNHTSMYLQAHPCACW